MKRRHFLTHLFQALGIAMIAPRVFAEQTRGARPGAGTGAAAGAAGDLALPAVDPASPAAKAVHYSQKKSDVKDATLKIERSGVPFEKQHCGACGFYTKVGQKGGGEVGKCTIFAGQLVKSDAWCGSWNKKA